MRTKEEFRELMRGHIRKGKWDELFTSGGCYFFALVLHEELNLPLFYASPPDSTEFRHVFIMRGCECIDYSGKRPIEVVAELYAGWPDEKPRPTCPSEIRTQIKEKELGNELEGQICQIAKKEFTRRRQEFL
jgi:hypothetical protein